MHHSCLHVLQLEVTRHRDFVPFNFEKPFCFRIVSPLSFEEFCFALSPYFGIPALGLKNYFHFCMVLKRA
jgi:hypothetical protein